LSVCRFVSCNIIWIKLWHISYVRRFATFNIKLSFTTDTVGWRSSCEQTRPSNAGVQWLLTLWTTHLYAVCSGICQLFGILFDKGAACWWESNIWNKVKKINRKMNVSPVTVWCIHITITFLCIFLNFAVRHWQRWLRVHFFWGRIYIIILLYARVNKKLIFHCY